MQVISEPSELVQVLYISWDWPFLYRFYLVWVCSYTVCTYDAAQYRYFGTLITHFCKFTYNWASPRVCNTASK